MFGQSVQLTATVIAAAGLTPTGTVTFYSGGHGVGTVNLPANGIAVLNTSALPVGTDSLTAVYTPANDSFTTSTSTPVSEPVSAAQNNHQPGLETANRSGRPAADALGRGRRGSARFGPTDRQRHVHGRCQHTRHRHTKCRRQPERGHTQPAGRTGRGQPLALRRLPATTNYAGSHSSTINEVVNKAATTLGLASSLNPAAAGQPITFTATIAAVSPSQGVPTGTVNFKDNGTVIGSGTLSVVGGQDIATFTTSSLKVGGHTVTAVYLPSAGYQTSTSAPLSQTVDYTTTTTLGVQPNSGVAGQTITLTAAGRLERSPLAGQVTFYDGLTSLGSSPVSGGQAALVTQALEARRPRTVGRVHAVEQHVRRQHFEHRERDARASSNHRRLRPAPSRPWSAKRSR